MQRSKKRSTLRPFPRGRSVVTNDSLRQRVGVLRKISDVPSGLSLSTLMMMQSAGSERRANPWSTCFATFSIESASWWVGIPTASRVMPINYSQSVLICLAAKLFVRRVAGFCEKSHQLVKKMGLSHEQSMSVTQKNSAFHRHAQRSAFRRRDVPS